MKKLLLLAFALQSAYLWAQPTDNPYRSMYNPVSIHWTDSLKWHVVTVATEVGITPDDNLDDSAAIAQAIQTIHTAGGGVLYFPPGVYNVSGYITMKSGVILRGANPTGITSAKTEGYNPGSKIIFPKYVFDTLANDGKGTDNNTAFKGIVNEYEFSNGGVVNLDVNRGYVSFQPDFNPTPGAPYSTPQPIQQNRNIIVFGVRNNNAAIPDPGIPQPDSPQKQWQRYCWRFSTNVDVTAAANCVVANCRANGEPDLDETFAQPGYVYRVRNTNNWPAHPDGTTTRFDYNEHYGISVNRKKKKKNTTTGNFEIYPFTGYATPETEPSLFCPGIEIRDNWIFNNSRVAIMGAGNGLVIDGNVSRMDMEKEEVMKYLVAPVGRTTVQGATTLENRGIDFSGWNSTVSNNDMIVSRSRVGGYLTTDGEGILLQECCGGTVVNDFRILNNITNGRYIGLYKMRTLNNVEVTGNNLQGGPIWLWANTNNADYYLNNVHVKKNQGITQINLNGDKGGINVLVDSNTSDSPNRTIKVPCYAVVGPNNAGFIAPEYNNGGEPCLPTPNYPKVDIIEPASNVVFCEAPADSVTIRFKLTGGIPDSNTLSVYRGFTVIASGIKVGADSTASIKVATPNAGQYLNNYVVKSRQKALYNQFEMGDSTVYELSLESLDALSETRSVQRLCEYTGPIMNVSEELFSQELRVYPNPGTGVYSIAGADVQTTITVYNYMGQKILSTTGISFDISSQSAGMYYVEILTDNKKAVLRVVKN